MGILTDGKHVWFNLYRGGRTGGEKNTGLSCQKEMRLRSWVCKGGLREENGNRRLMKAHINISVSFSNFSQELQQRRNETLYLELEFIIFRNCKTEDSANRAAITA